MSVFSPVAGSPASDLEDLAARGRLDETQPLIGRLQAIGLELIGQVTGASYEDLRRQAGAADITLRGSRI